MKQILDFKTILAILALITPVVLYFMSKEFKEVSFKNIAFTELVSNKKVSDNSIRVYFEDRQVKNIYSVSCVLKNTGNVAITEDDLVDYFKIKFHDSVEILKYEIKPEPSDVKIKDSLGHNGSLFVKTDLLNPNNKLNLAFYLSAGDKSRKELSIEGRIINGEILELEESQDFKSKTKFSNSVFYGFESAIYWIGITYTILYFLIFFYAIYFSKENQNNKPIAKFFGLVVFSIGLFCTMFYMLQTR